MRAAPRVATALAAEDLGAKDTESTGGGCKTHNSGGVNEQERLRTGRGFARRARRCQPRRHPNLYRTGNKVIRVAHTIPGGTARETRRANTAVR